MTDTLDRAAALALIEDFAAAYNEGDLSRLDRCLAVDYRRPNPNVRQGREGMREAVAGWWAAVRPLRLEVEDVIVEGDRGRIVARMTFSGTQVGEILGIPPTGRDFSVALIDVFAVENGLLAGHWDVMDLLGLHRQLGALPA